MRLFLLLALLLGRTAAAQPAADFADVTPDAVLSATWAEAFGGAEAVAWALDDIAADTTGAPPETAGDARRARALAAVASAGTAATLSAAMQFSLALAEPAERATVYAALGEDTMALHGLLTLLAETVDPPPDDATLFSAAPTGTLGAPDVSWSERAAQVRTLTGRLIGSVAALGIATE